METSEKSFWQRPEGKTGMLFLIVGLFGLGYVALHVLPFLILILQNAIYTVVLAVALIAMVTVLLDRKFQVRVKALYQLAMKWLTGWIVELDPIGIIENYLDKLQDSLEKMSKKLDLLSGQEAKIRTKIQNYERDIEKARDIAIKAKSKMVGMDESSTEYMRMKNTAALNANQVGRLDSSKNRLQDVLNKIVGLRKVLEKMYSNAEFMLNDMTEDVKIKKEMRESINSGYGAYQQAVKILEGDKDELALFNEGLEFVATDMANKVGEMERFIDRSGAALTSMDIEKEVFSDKGLKLIEEWSNKGNMLDMTSPKLAISGEKEKVLVVNDNMFGERKTNKYY